MERQTPTTPAFPKTPLRRAKFLHPLVMVVAWVCFLGLLPIVASHVAYSFEVVFRTDNRVIAALAYPSSYLSTFGRGTDMDLRTEAQREYDDALYQKVCCQSTTDGEELLPGVTLPRWEKCCDWALVVVFWGALMGLVLSTALRDSYVAIAKGTPECEEMYPKVRRLQFNQAWMVLEAASGDPSQRPTVKRILLPCLKPWQRFLLYLGCFILFLLATSQITYGVVPIPSHTSTLLLGLLVLAFFATRIIKFSVLHRTLNHWEKAQTDKRTRHAGLVQVAPEKLTHQRFS